MGLGVFFYLIFCLSFIKVKSSCISLIQDRGKIIFNIYLIFYSSTPILTQSFSQDGIDQASTHTCGRGATVTTTRRRAPGGSPQRAKVWGA